MITVTIPGMRLVSLTNAREHHIRAKMLSRGMRRSVSVSKDKPSRVRVHPLEQAERLRELALLESEGKLTKRLMRQLAEQWGIQRTQMERITAEARRSLVALFDGKEAEAIRAMLMRRLDLTYVEAFRKGRLGEAIRACVAQADLAGANAPQKHEHDVRIAELRAMAPDEVRARLKEHVAKHEELYRELLQEIGDEQARAARAISEGAAASAGEAGHFPRAGESGDGEHT